MAARFVSWIPVEWLEWSFANCGMVQCVVGKVHGRQELFTVEGVIVDVRCQVFFDALAEIFHLGIALWMSRCSFGLFNVPQGPKFIGQLVTKFFASAGRICSGAAKR